MFLALQPGQPGLKLLNPSDVAGLFLSAFIPVADAAGNCGSSLCHMSQAQLRLLAPVFLSCGVCLPSGSGDVPAKPAV